MRALLNVGGGIAGLEMAEIPMPAPREGELLVRVRAAALAFPDLLQLDDLYQVRRERPYVPGMEVAGEVEAVGPGVTAFRPGDAVFGSSPRGGVCEYAVMPADRAMPMSATMTFVEAAGFTSSYATAYHALRQRAELRTGESLLVLSAAGALGLATVQIGKAFGAHVIAAGSTEAKVALAKEHGADQGVVYPVDPDKDGQKAFGAALKALRPGGIDVVADIVGGAYTEPAIRAIAWNGRLLILGFPSGIPKIAANLLLLKGAAAVGVNAGGFIQHEPDVARRNMAELVALHGEGKLTPHVAITLPMERAGEGLAMLARRELLGKLIVTTD